MKFCHKCKEVVKAGQLRCKNCRTFQPDEVREEATKMLTGIIIALMMFAAGGLMWYNALPK